MAKRKLIDGSNHQATKIINRSLVLKMICTWGNLSRIDIARRTGLSKMSITNIVNELISEGFVIETGSFGDIFAGTTSGRKPVVLAANTGKYQILGVYISRDYVAATLNNLKCEIIAEQKCRITDEDSQDSFTEKLFILIKSILNQSEVTDKVIMGIGVSCIGPLDIKNGIILEPANFHGLRNIPIKRLLEEEFGCEVFVNNDMNASALAEKLYGKGRDNGNFIYVGVTNGIGAGIIANNILFEGDMGFSGEIGHITINFDGHKCICGNNGCLELYASIPEIVRQAEAMVSEFPSSALHKLSRIEWADIASTALNGDTLSLHLLKLLAGYLSHGIVSLINFFDPQAIYLGHDIALAGGLVAEMLQADISRRFFSSRYKNVPVEISFYGHNTPLAGSAAIILDKLFSGHDFNHLRKYNFL